MISVRDFVHLPYTADLTEAGVTYARRVLPRLRVPRGRARYDAMRRTAAATALQLAFQRYLAEQGIEFAVRSAVPFSEPEEYDIHVGGRSCKLKSFLISRQPQIDALEANPSVALTAPALVPADRYAAEQLRGDDLYLFAFVTAAVADAGARTGGNAAVNGSEFWLHSMPPSWMRPRTWSPLGQLILKSESGDALRVELSGEDALRTPTEIVAELLPGQRTDVDTTFYSLDDVHTVRRPAARIGIHSPSRNQTHVIESGEWHNVWLRGQAIWLLGWITRELFRARARQIPEGQPVFQFSRTRTKNLAVDVASLKPLQQLLDRLRNNGRLAGSVR